MTHRSARRIGLALMAGALTLTLVGPASTASLEDGGPLDLSSEFDGRLDGAASSHTAGDAVAPAGDFNDDGAQDLIIGSAGGDRAYVVFGGAELGIADLGALGAGGVTIVGTAGDDFGRSVAGAGDVNDDGIDDVIIGAPDADGGPGADSGSAWVVYGSASPATTVSVGALNPATSGFEIVGATIGGDAGTSVAGLGDVNDDGVDDVVVGSEQVGSTPDTGRADVVFGVPASGTPADVSLGALGAGGVTFAGAASGDRAGYAVAPAGDVDDDGVADLLIGARAADTGGSGSGSAYVLFGSPAIAGGTLGSLAAGAEIEISGGSAGDATGEAVAGAGDVNADGVDDVIVGSPGDEVPGVGRSGSAAVVFGSTTPGDVALGALGDDGLLITGADADDVTGHRVSGDRDVNGDGTDDILVASRDDSAGGADAGSAHVIYGRSGLSGSVALGSLGTAGTRIDGAAAGDTVAAAALAPDLTGDGKQDVLIGSPFAGNNGPGSGSAYVVDGFSLTTLSYETTALAGGAAVTLSPAVTATGPATFAATGLPSGLSIDAVTGRISGTPTAVGTFAATITVNDDTGPNAVPVTFTVSSGVAYTAVPLTLRAAASLPASVAAEGTPSFTASGLPAGLDIDSRSGTISGTPTALGSSAVTVTMLDDHGSVTADLTLTVSLPAPDGSPAPSPRAGDFVCSGRTLEFRRSTRGAIRLTRGQLLTNQRIAQAAIRRLTAIERWLNAGIESDDLCGHSFGGASFDDGVVTQGGGPIFPATAADPRPLAIPARRTDEPGRIRLTRGQLVINQRVYQVALLRARAIKRRIGGRLAGGDLADAAVTPGKLVPGTRIVSRTPPSSPVARSLTDRVTAKQGAARGVRLTRSQLRINQAIARTAIEETNALRARLVVGLSSTNFAADTITANQIAGTAAAS